MIMAEAMSMGALVVLGSILLVLLLQYLRLRELWRMALSCRKSARWGRIWQAENRELRSALRAEKAHIQQLQRKVGILQGVIEQEG